jgi:hypothetical protein
MRGKIHLVLPGVAWLACFAAVGCKSHVFENDLRHHVLALDHKGRAVDPQSRERIDDLEDYVVDLLGKACSGPPERDDLGAIASPAKGETEVRKILIYIHGGLNSSSASREKADTLLSHMKADAGAVRPYPIFITWPSGGLSSYGDHLWTLRQGRREPYFGPLTSPLFLISDLGRGIARAPRSLSFQFLSDTALGVKVAFDKDVLQAWKNAKSLQPEAAKVYSIGHGDYHRGTLTQVGRFFAYLLTFPIKLFTQTLAVDAMAEGAWNVMLHRIDNLFHRPREFDVREIRDEPEKLADQQVALPGGALAEFLRLLDQQIRLRPSQKFELTLVGHSMGAIVLNKSLPFLSSDYVQRIVYMAPACSIRETVQSVVPFLHRSPQTTFHVLTLHPLAEVGEINFLDLVPRGSLLEWIDNWYTTPSSHPDRRLGKWLNLVQALHLFASVKDRFSVKAFSTSPGSLPQAHGEFNQCPFWRPEFWDPEGPLEYYYDEDQKTWTYKMAGSK